MGVRNTLHKSSALGIWGSLVEVLPLLVVEVMFLAFAIQ